jgi:tetratricopeptide (TPR) repeat protein
MKPKILCAECGKEIRLGDQNCPNCGNAVEWQPEGEVSESGEPAVGARTCNRCGSENAADASFCGSCGAKLQGSKKPPLQSARKPEKQERGRESKKRDSDSNPLFSWKVIAGFLGLLLILVVAVDLFSKKEQAPVQEQSAAPSMPAANMQLAGQISELEKEVTANPSDMQALLKLANLSHDGRFFDKAIAYYKRYLEKNVKDANARVDLGICYFENGDTEEAQKQMLTALKYDPKHLQAHFNLGIVNLKARRMQEANDWFKKTIALAPANSEIGQQAKQFLEQHSSPLIQNK